MGRLWKKSGLFYGLLIICSMKLLDVLALTCDSSNFCQCASGTSIVHEKFICDEEDDCEDGSDELNCGKRQCLATEHKCKSGRCIRKEWTCDNYADCLDGSDEDVSLCNFTSCESDEFQCYNGVCLSGALQCDREQDCLEGEDEKDCVYPLNCSAGYFQCKNLKCIDEKFLCDGDDDCGDQTDESACSQTCSPGSFTCKSGECIPENLKCNGNTDCPDASDEESCPTVKPPSCSADEFLCDGQCTPGFFKCDGEEDCSDGIDELSCKEITCPSSSEAKCDDGKSCIMKYKFCNGRVDCADGSDEKPSRCSLPSTTVVPSPSTLSTCATNEYKCKDALQCISKTKVCNQNPDCPNGDDEISCLVNECEKDHGNCSHICHDTDTSYYCSCKHGFRMQNDTKTCLDINECETVGKCSQICTNTEGSYKCSCTSGYVSSPNGRSCLPGSGKREKLIVAVGMDVRSVTHDGSQVKCLVGKRTKNAVAVGVHHKKNIMFWADAYMGKIFSSLLSESEPAKVVASASSITDLAIDWITEKLYWLTTAQHVSEIHVAEFNGSNHKIIHAGQDRIHSIVVDPVGGYLYWTSPFAGKISRAFMNGEHKEDIVTTALQSPTGLTIDFPNKKLFWFDSKMHRIESSDFDGTNRRRILVYESRHPFDIAVFGDKIYWSDSLLKTVSSANKFTGMNKTVLIDSENITSFVPKGISIQHSLSQPQVANRCKKNGGCSHLCLLIPEGFKCACPENGTLMSDKKTCKIVLKPTTIPTTMPTTMPTTTPSTKATSITSEPKKSEAPTTEEVLKPTTIPTTMPTTMPTTTPTTTPSTKATSITSEPKKSEAPTTEEDSSFVKTELHVFPTKQTTNADRAEGSSSISPQIIGGIVAGVVFVILVLIIVMWCRKKKNSGKGVVHYFSKAEHVKIPSSLSPTPESIAGHRGNPTQSKKNVDRDAYFMFPNRNFKDLEEDEDLDGIGEEQPVLKTGRQREDEESLIGPMV